MNYFTLISSLILLAFVRPAHASVSFDPADSPPLRFAAAEIERAAKDTKQPVPDVTISMMTGAPQSYRIERNGAQMRVIGGDTIGAMYGGLDIAEAIRMGTLDSLQDSDHTPHIERRGIKFNIPLDVRTPSYSDNCTSAQANIPEMWSLDFWHELLDRMARDRFNVLTLWSLHPFPSIVKVPEYPKVALDDVWRTTADLVKPFNSFTTIGTSVLQPWMLENPEIVPASGVVRRSPSMWWRYTPGGMIRRTVTRTDSSGTRTLLGSSWDTTTEADWASAADAAEAVAMNASPRRRFMAHRPLCGRGRRRPASPTAQSAIDDTAGAGTTRIEVPV